MVQLKFWLIGRAHVMNLPVFLAFNHPPTVKQNAHSANRGKNHQKLATIKIKDSLIELIHTIPDTTVYNSPFRSFDCGSKSLMLQYFNNSINAASNESDLVNISCAHLSLPPVSLNPTQTCMPLLNCLLSNIRMPYS